MLVVWWLAAHIGATLPVFAGPVTLDDLGSSALQQRWLDVAEYPYGVSYQTGYDYAQGLVHAVFSGADTLFQGTLTAVNLKPNATYQLKLQGSPGTASGERIGLTGRWWEEEWNGNSWANGHNLNNKGDGSSPNPNDLVYFQRRDLPDPSGTSPTGKRYRYTGYLVFDYVTTDSLGNVTAGYAATSSYHVLWNTTQRTPAGQDGPPDFHTLDPDPLVHPAYELDYPETTVVVFGEWERLPAGDVRLPPGSYSCQLVMTEESFHGSGGQYAGSWAGAVGAGIEFIIVGDVVHAPGTDTESVPVPKLYPASPNPFRTSMSIGLEVPDTGALHVLDVTGRVVVALHTALPPGAHRAVWDGRDTAGRFTAAGVYYLALTAPGFTPVTQVITRLP